MRIFIWHVHGSYSTALVQGPHEYFVPVLPGRGPYGRGRAETWDWPHNVVEVGPSQASTLEVDVLLVQRPAELRSLAEVWLGGRQPGRDLPTIYLEHNAPQGRINDMRHPASDRPDLTLVHVTHFNDLFWDAGSTPTVVVEHGIVDPGYRYTGEMERLTCVVNEPVRRGRVTGTDLLSLFGRAGPIDLFGMGTGELGGIPDLSQEQLHRELPRRRLYVHPFRWTSLGLALLEAMHLGLPVVALATTEVAEAVPPEAGIISTDLDRLVDAASYLLVDHEEATRLGKEGRRHALERFGLERFLADWDRVFEAQASR